MSQTKPSKASPAVLLLVRVVLMVCLALVMCLMTQAFSQAYTTARQVSEIVEARNYRRRHVTLTWREWWWTTSS